LTIRGEELAACNDFLHVTFSGKKLANKDGMFGKSDPYISLKKCTHRACWIGSEEDWRLVPDEWTVGLLVQAARTVPSWKCGRATW
jgi:hypothetical protein